MAYLPNNQSIFLAAFSGALAGMAAGGKVIVDPNSSDYDGLSSVAGAFAQAIDSAWGITDANQAEVDSMEEACESSWQERTPQTVAPFNTPTNWSTLATAIVALVRSGNNYLVSQGVISPVVSPLVADYLIVGLGTAGAALARYLSEDMITSVIAFESGNNLGTDPNVLLSPSSPQPLTNDPKYAKIRSYDTRSLDQTVRAPATGYSDGRLWGGSSGHNGLQAVRSSGDVFDAWATASGNTRWSYTNILPFMKFLEGFVPNGVAVNATQRGLTGAIGFCDSGVAPANGLFTALAVQTNSNLLLNGDYNDLTQYIGGPAPQTPGAPARGVAAPFQRFIHQSAPPVNGTWAANTSVRSWAQDYLPLSVVNADGSAVAPRKLSIQSEATVLRVIIEDIPGDGLTAVGIEYFISSSPSVIRTARAKKKVIICGGANASPQLLQLSGVGPAAVLNPLGIPVLVDSPNVGKNLQNHYGATVMLPFDAAHPAPTFDGGRIFQFGDGSSPGSLVPPIAPAIGTNDGIRRVQNFSTGSFAISANTLKEIYGTLNGFPVTVPPITGVVSLLSFNLRPNKLGTVTIVSKDPTIDPRISAGFYQDGVGPTSDLQAVVNMFKVFANISLAWTGRLPLYPPANHYPAAEYPSPTADGRDATAVGDTLLIGDAKNILLQAAFHNSGSCRMGTDITNGVVDGDLNVFGVKGLSVADNSVTTEIATGNTAHPAYLIGLVKAKIEGAIGLP